MEPLRRSAPLIRWTDSSRIHLTLKFLGEQPEDAVLPLIEAMRRVSGTYDPVELELGGLGAFPNLRRPRIVWLGVQGDAKLELLQHDLEAACASLGHEVEGRPFRPHLTLARVGDARLDAAALARAARGVRFRESMVVQSIDLMVSEGSPAGPRYRLLGAAMLGRC